ncbi:MAG: hypothetical protein FWG57_05330 [Endomicrobia bacterium]|jgi:superoxide reductase|nr:hypothetical protein [Endomicrobiia bacterium]
MKGLVCKVCDYIALDGNTELCPVCGAKNAFEEKEDAYKMPDFKAEKGESEKKHIPSILVVEECGLIPGTGCIDVHVKVGEIPHPMTPEHHISTIYYYLDKKFVAVMHMSGNGEINAAAAAHFKGGSKGVVSIIEQCNIHGSWYNEVKIGH